MSMISSVVILMAVAAAVLAYKESSSGKAHGLYSPHVQITKEMDPILFRNYVLAKLLGYFYVLGFLFAFLEYGTGINGHPYEIGIGAMAIGFLWGPKFLEIVIRVIRMGAA